jgi:catecholate siderophore receptor
MLRRLPTDRFRPELAVSRWALAVALLPATAFAQGTTPTPLPTIGVEADRPADQGYQTERPSSPKFTEPLRDTPQSITVVPKELMEERGVTTLREALRNVPGISIQAGEGGGPQGDNLTIRGFNARSDIYIDGMRDFGQYARDPFNLEAVEVLKGPSSLVFGRGSTGGVINQVTKVPGRDPLIASSFSFGTDMTKRLTADVNQPIPGLDGAALRINALVHDSEVADRDFISNTRWGVAPSISFGIGGPTQFTFSYFHLYQNNVPDYGHPYLFGRPAPIPRNTFFGFAPFNQEQAIADVATATISHEFNSAFKIRNQLRYAQYTREAFVSPPRINGTPTPATPLSQIFTTGGNTGRNSTDTLLLNQTDATVNFATGFLRHTVVTGIEIGRETSNFTGLAFTAVPAGINNQSLINPANQVFPVGGIAASSNTRTTGDTFAVYAIDTVKLGEQLELIGGIRYDRFDADFENSFGNLQFNRVDDMPSYRAGIVYKPMKIASIYFAYGTSFNPSAEALSLAANNANLDPEETRSFEVGTKWDLLGEKLSLRAALFRTEKTNARTPDPVNNTLNVLQGVQQVDGFEAEAAGTILPGWQVFAGYAYLDSEILSSNTAAEVGKELQNVAPHNFTLWTTYDLPFGVQVGGGLLYVDGRFGNNTNTVSVPSYLRFDATIAWRVTENVDVRLNLFNLTDEFYYDAITGGQAVPGAGRSALLTTNVRF